MIPRVARSLLGAALLAACASKGQVRRLETLVQTVRVEHGRRDSARAAELLRVIQLQQRILDSLGVSRQALRVLDARLGNDFTEVQRQLLAVQELTGQSQKRLTELKAQLDARAEQRDAQPLTSNTSVATDTTRLGPPAAVSADQMFQSALQLYRRGSIATARQAFLEFLQTYPSHSLVPDATYFIGESYEQAAPDSALVRYNEVVTRFPQSSRAPQVLYKIGLLAERRNDIPTARAAYQRVIQQYPRSEQADLAADRLKNLRP